MTSFAVHVLDPLTIAVAVDTLPMRTAVRIDLASYAFFRGNVSDFDFTTVAGMAFFTNTVAGFACTITTTVGVSARLCVAIVAFPHWDCLVLG